MDEKHRVGVKAGYGGKGIGSAVEPVSKSPNWKGSILARGRQPFALREHHIFLSVAAGTFFTGLLLSWLIFPPAYGAPSAFVDLKTTLTSAVPLRLLPSAQADANPVEEYPGVQADQDLIEKLQQSAVPAGYATQPLRSQWQTVRMRVTGYCACAKCCGKFADGITACNHRIGAGDTFVAADRFYAFGTEMVIPGYNNNRSVSVMDRGKAIKGNRLDLFFHTHEEAQRWGVKNLDVLVRID